MCLFRFWLVDDLYLESRPIAAKESDSELKLLKPKKVRLIPSVQELFFNARRYSQSHHCG